MEEKEKKDFCENLKEQTEKAINSILENGIEMNNVDALYKLVDIHKDVANEEYWKYIKEEKDMRYSNYGRGQYGDDVEQYGNYGNYGEYSEGSYGRRGVKGTGRGRYRGGRGSGRYRGEEMMDEMMYHYGNYNEGREQYGADDETMKSFKYMLKSFKDYYKHLKQEASSQQEVKMLEDVAREISEM